MPKYIHDGGSNIFTLLSKKLVRPFGFKKIRTPTGAFQSFSRGARGKKFRLFGKLRTRSTGNLTKRMNYMNKRISGKTQKVEGYSFKLKEAQMKSQSRLNKYKNDMTPHTDKIAKLKDLQEKGTKLNPRQLRELKNAESSVRSLQKTQKSILKSYSQKSAEINRKMRKAQTRLDYKVTKYAAKQKKYKGLMERKLYKSQKRLDKGFTKTCKNLKKTPGKSPMACLEAFEKCKAKGNSLNLDAMTGCVNAESALQGLPIDLKKGDITTTMTKLANKHFLRRFKRGRHLREISRITSGKGAKLQTSMNETAKTLQYGKVLANAPSASGVGALSKARTRQLTGQNIVPGTGVKDFSTLTGHKLSMVGPTDGFDKYASTQMQQYAKNKAIKWSKRLDKFVPGFMKKKGLKFNEPLSPSANAAVVAVNPLFVNPLLKPPVDTGYVPVGPNYLQISTTSP